MSKKSPTAISKTVISPTGKTAITTYPDGRMIIHNRASGSPDFTGPRQYPPKPQTRPVNAVPTPAPKPPSFRELLRKELGLDHFKPKR